MLLGADGMIAYTPVGPLVPALHSYWFVIHVSTIILASGIFLIGAVPAAMFLIRNGYDRGKRGFPYTLGRHVPAAVTLERLTFRLHAFAFPLFTFGALIAGPLWAEASWGRYWGWDPKEVWAFISWIVYAALPARPVDAERQAYGRDLDRPAGLRDHADEPVRGQPVLLGPALVRQRRRYVEPAGPFSDRSNRPPSSERAPPAACRSGRG